MLVNGTHAASFEEAIDKAQALPSAFPDLVTLRQKITVPLNPKAHQASADGIKLFEHHQYEEARKKFTAALKINESEENISGRADNYFYIAHCYLNEGNYKKAKEALIETVFDYIITNKIRQLTEVFYDLVAICEKDGTLAEVEQEMRVQIQEAKHPVELIHAHLTLGAIESSRNNPELARQHYFRVYEVRQGNIIPDALRVEQHEAGFSDKRPIGTENLQQCVAVILHDPDSKRTALAHFDIATDPESLRSIIGHMPNVPLQARIVGGKGNDSYSERNVHQVLKILSDYDHINLISADIRNKVQPTAIVFYPETGALKHAYPGEQYAEQRIRDGKINISSGIQRPLEIVFDVKGDTNPDRKPIKLGKDHINKLASLQHLSEEEIANVSCIEMPNQALTHEAKFASGTIAVAKAHKQELQRLQDTVTSSASQQGGSISRTKFSKIKQIITATQKHIGEKAAEANTSIESSLSEALYKKSLSERLKPKNWKNALIAKVTGSSHVSVDMKKLEQLAEVTSDQTLSEKEGEQSFQEMVQDSRRASVQKDGRGQRK